MFIHHHHRYAGAQIGRGIDAMSDRQIPRDVLKAVRERRLGSVPRGLGDLTYLSLAFNLDEEPELQRILDEVDRDRRMDGAHGNR